MKRDNSLSERLRFDDSSGVASVLKKRIGMEILRTEIKF
jgi:hypothetical protein